jgi:Zn-dependent peptidase ImmA (M78 family)
MSASVVDAPAPLDETKVCPRSESALDVVDVRAKRKIKEEAERDAARLLKATMSLDVPVDSAAIASQLGLRVLVMTLKEATLGGLVMKPGDDPRIVVNRRDGYLRQRLTCALELGHYVRRSAVTNQYARVDLRDEPVSADEEPEDLYAHEFAASLLMPSEDVGILRELKMDDLEMALRFMVPREAMQLRLKDLGLRAPDGRSSRQHGRRSEGRGPRRGLERAAAVSDDR